jgi:hypothetical protein
MKQKIAKISGDLITVTGEHTSVFLNRFDTPNQFFEILAKMKHSQLQDYMKNCGEYYSDIIENQPYVLTEGSRPQEDFYRILKVNEKNEVMEQKVIYLKPTTILSLP